MSFLVTPNIFPHLPVPYIFGTRGLVTWYIGNWELGSKYTGNWKIRVLILAQKSWMTSDVGKHNRNRGWESNHSIWIHQSSSHQNHLALQFSAVKHTGKEILWTNPTCHKKEMQKIKKQKFSPSSWYGRTQPPPIFKDVSCYAAADFCRTPPRRDLNPPPSQEVTDVTGIYPQTLEVT